jgi:hypothetical protein
MSVRNDKDFLGKMWNFKFTYIIHQESANNATTLDGNKESIRKITSHNLRFTQFILPTLHPSITGINHLITSRSVTFPVLNKNLKNTFHSNLHPVKGTVFCILKPSVHESLNFMFVDFSFTMDRSHFLIILEQESLN